MSLLIKMSDKTSCTLISDKSEINVSFDCVCALEGDNRSQRHKYYK